MNNYEYHIIFFYLWVALLISLLLLFLASFLNPKTYNRAKLTGYECGFEPFGDARMKFNIHFYMVAILFIIFDVEIAFLFPWVLSAYNLSFWGYFHIIIFVIILVIGLIYELCMEALDW